MTSSMRPSGHEEGKAIRQALLREAHRLIDDAADHAVEHVARGAASTLTYPPGDGETHAHRLTEAEATALAALGASAEARSGLRKLVREAAASSLFGLFSLIDGVADPADWDGEVWLGADLVPPTEDEDRELLHDGFFDSYWHARAPARR